ncbi:MAG TPA: MFS transporter, partial [Verrucomicrobiae bacterium]|nr:MFS transporter [Verrucomicrobiae bacterium]
MSLPSNPPAGDGVAWWKHLNRYHWFVLLVAALGWLFDCLDQQIFTLSRGPAMKALLPAGADPLVWGTYATSVFLIGWATGGLFFGVLGDRIGRAKTMMITILMYSVCTGLSALSQSFWDFAFYRFITGLGVGGEFAGGVALVTEVMPTPARAGALGLLQALSTVGNVSAALLGLGMSQLEAQNLVKPSESWRYMFLIGALPALLALVIRARLKEPDRWLELKNSGALAKRKAFTYAELFGHPVWSRRAIVGMLLACAGIIGLWGIGFFTPELVRTVLSKSFRAEGLAEKEIPAKVGAWASGALLMLQVGAFFGMMVFSRVVEWIGRKKALALGYVLACVATIAAFGAFNSRSQVFWLIPLMGFGQLSLFAIYAIYLPELFPTH